MADSSADPLAQGELIRAGFTDSRSARRDLAAVCDWARQHAPALAEPAAWFDLLEGVPDPDVAIGVVAHLVRETPDRWADVLGEGATLRRLLLVAGASRALGQHLQRHPETLAVLREPPRPRTRAELLAEVMGDLGVAPAEALAVADASVGVDGLRDRLRWANKRALVRLAARDLTAADPLQELPSVAAELADLADAIVNGALAIARTEVPEHARTRLAVLAMGKCGARELNYLSDIDVLFVAEPADAQTSTDEAIAIATRLAASLMRHCSAFTAAGSIWQVDAALRPEGNAGQLVRSLASMRAYYEKWAKNWEFQAMLKARPMAGDADLATEFTDMLAPMVWSVAGRPGFMAETQAMRKRVISLIPPKEQGREMKLGAGGLRDTEFTVQLLQLVHGKGDERLRLRGTFEALRALSEHAYIGRADAAEMETAYCQQRLLEHRVQMYHLRRTHLLPADDAGLRRLARGLGLRQPAEVVDLWRSSARTVQRLHQKVFYSPLLETVARISSDALRLTPEAARERMVALGFADPDTAMRHIQALTSGVTRKAGIQRQLMSAMLGWFAEAPSPDAGLLAFRQMSDDLKDSPWYLRALRDEGQMASRLARILASSRYAVDLLRRNPDSVHMLAHDDDLVPQSCERILAAMQATAGRHDDEQEAAHAVRAVRRRELFRVVMADLLGLIDLDEVGEALTTIASATMQATLDIARRGVDQAPDLGIVALGRWGGRELAYGSDADAMFVMPDTDDPDATRRAGQVIARLRSLLAAPGPDPVLEVDLDLRPEGRQGPMVRTLGSYKAYYQRWSDTWEAQALVRASHGAGNPDLVAELLAAIDAVRFPEQGVSRGQLAEIRKLKVRMERERLPRGTDPKRHLKLGPGGLSDVEWTIQLMQMRHGARVPGLRTTGTMAALDAAREAELISASDALALREAWQFASRLRNAIMLNRARASDMLPGDARERGAICYLLGRAPGTSAELVDDYLRAARHASAVVDRLFWKG